MADDIALLEDTQKGMKDFTYKTPEEAAKAHEPRQMQEGEWKDTEGITKPGGNEIETMDAFCYLESTLTNDSSCDKEKRARIGKVNAAFGRVEKYGKAMAVESGPRFDYTRQWYSARCSMAQIPGQLRWRMGRNWIQRTTNGSEEYCISLRETRL